MGDLISNIVVGFVCFILGCIYSDSKKRIPSDQPEIVRCKDCRWGREKFGNIECFADINVPSEYHGYDWFCPNGEREDNG